MTVDELKAIVAPCQAIDLVTVAQAFHRFDHPTSYQRVKWLLKGPNGVLAVWFYDTARINDSIDVVLERVYAESDPFWAPPRKMVDDEYRSFEFPFEPVEEQSTLAHSSLDAYLAFILSWSAYRTRQKV